MANYCIMETGYLKVILGSMFSGKTTELIKEYHRYNACGFKCCFINHSYDKKRFNSETNTQAHNNLTVKTDFYIDKLSDIKQTDYDKYDVFFINEGQFFEDLYEWVNLLVNTENKKIYVCGLDGDFERKKFGYILDIIPLCDDVVKIKAICKDCKNKEGIFTYRLTNETEQTVIGCDNYLSLCRECYNRHFFVEKL